MSLNFNDAFSHIDKVFEETCDDFHIEHNNKIVCTVKGFFCGRNYPSTIQVHCSNKIEEGDWIIHDSTKSKYYINNPKPLTESNKIIGWMIQYKTEKEYQDTLVQNNQSTISIGNIYGSAIVGNYNSSTINNGYNLNEVRSLISNKPIEDQEDLNKLIDRIQTITEDNQPVSKGTFAKFSDLLAKHSDIAIALGSSLMSWLSS